MYKTMKKIYQVPALTVEQMAECMPIAASPAVTINKEGNIAAEGVEVKSAGEWEDIWE